MSRRSAAASSSSRVRANRRRACGSSRWRKTTARPPKNGGKKPTRSTLAWQPSCAELAHPSPEKRLIMGKRDHPTRRLAILALSGVLALDPGNAAAAEREDLLQKLYPAANAEGEVVVNTARLEEAGGDRPLAPVRKGFPRSR